MSRFFRQAEDSSSSESESDDELLSSGSDNEDAPLQAVKKPGSRFLKTANASDSDSDSDSDDDDDLSESEGGSEDEAPLRIKSASEKRIAEMGGTSGKIINCLKNGDWVVLSTEFDKLVRMVQKDYSSGLLPPVLIKTLISLDDAVKESKDKSKKMSATNAKALTAMKQKVKKGLKEWEAAIKTYQANPESYERDFTAANAPAPSSVQRAPAPIVVANANDDDGFVTVGRAVTDVFKSLASVQEARGKKGTDRGEQVRFLERILAVTSTRYQQIRVLLALVSARFDYGGANTAGMGVDMWRKAMSEVGRLITILKEDNMYIVCEGSGEYDDMVERSPVNGEPVRIRGSIISFVERLDDEFGRQLQALDAHGTEYVERLQEEGTVYKVIKEVGEWYETVDSPEKKEALDRIAIRRLEHLYYKPDAVVQALDPSSLINTLCLHLYKSQEPPLRTRAILCHIYHHALHNNFTEARDMLLMSHLQETIHNADVPTQILYNRTVVQLGLCAFRCGLVSESHAILVEIQTTGRVKELLAQGGRYQDSEQDKSRLLPFHMHINTDLVEAAFFISSMLVEIPLLASITASSALDGDARRKAISKPFRRLLDSAERQVFSGPPETIRDHVVQASKALMEGDWHKANELTQSIKIWSLLPVDEREKIMLMLGQQIREQGLRTYLFTYKSWYTSVSLALLSKTFDMPESDVRAVISRMIWSDELQASLQGEGLVFNSKTEATKQQLLALQLADKVSAMCDSSEKTLEAKLGSNYNRESTNVESKGQGAERRRNNTNNGKKGVRGSRFAQGLGSGIRV